MIATAIILAGRRDGRRDPLADQAGVELKALVPIAGEPLIAHVLRAVLASKRIGEVRVVGSDAETLCGCLPPDVLSAGERVECIPAALNLVDSVRGAAEGVAFPLLITTADNVLLTRSSVDEFLAKAASLALDGAAVAFARKNAVLAAHPAGQRKFYTFADGEFSNCNLYWVGDRRALAAADTFRSGGQFVKHPLRIAQAFGIANLIRFRLGMGASGKFFDRLSRGFGFPIRLVELSDGACAIDVDNARSHAIAQELLERRTLAPIAA